MSGAVLEVVAEDVGPEVVDGNAEVLGQLVKLDVLDDPADVIGPLTSPALDRQPATGAQAKIAQQRATANRAPGRLRVT